MPPAAHRRPPPPLQRPAAAAGLRRQRLEAATLHPRAVHMPGLRMQLLALAPLHRQIQIAPTFGCLVVLLRDDIKCSGTLTLTLPVQCRTRQRVGKQSPGVIARNWGGLEDNILCEAACAD